MAERTLSVLDGSTFVVGDRLGDVQAGDLAHGFFSDDTRFVSRWTLSVDGAPLVLLGLDQDAHFAVRFFLAPRMGPDEQAPCSVIRRRCIDRVWLEEIMVINHRHERRPIRVTLDVDTDFADLFEVKADAVGRRDITWESDDTSLTLAYRRGSFERSVSIASSRPAEVTRNGLAFDLVLDHDEQWAVTLRVTPRSAQPGRTFVPRARSGSLDGVERAKATELEEWLADVPAIQAQDASLARTYRASLTDLAALRLQPDLDDPGTLPAAGLPWFMALFGRDSLITSFQALPYLPTLAASTLRVLAARQAVERDDFHEREPGKILHELRHGELTATGVQPHSPYYGSADATPLFLVLLDEYHRWTADDALVRALEPNARAALAWIADSGDLDGDGYVEYSRRNEATGLINQCWKDSWDSIRFADGTIASGPIATCEIQGYVFDAHRRSARLARDVWGDPALAERLELLAAGLRGRFHQDFWLPGARLPRPGARRRQAPGRRADLQHRPSALVWPG